MIIEIKTSKVTVSDTHRIAEMVYNLENVRLIVSFVSFSYFSE
jgi:hypothetical protein